MYIVQDDSSKTGVVIDPYGAKTITEEAKKLGVKVRRRLSASSAAMGDQFGYKTTSGHASRALESLRSVELDHPPADLSICILASASDYHPSHHPSPRRTFLSPLKASGS